MTALPNLTPGPAVMTTPSDAEPVAHPYARISQPDQKHGGGLLRQTTCADALKEFCRLFGFALSKRVLVDDGVSAFRGLNATPEHQLGKFLEEARRGTVRPGDCLILENYDRLSRQNPWAAISLVNDLRELKIHIGRLDRMKLLRYDSTDTGDFFEAAIELMRGNSESEAKSQRNGKQWALKRSRAQEGKPQPPRAGTGRVTRAITAMLPGWIEDRGGELALIPERAAVVKRIFALAAAGYGYVAVVRKLTEDKVPAFGEVVVREGRKRSAWCGKWTVPYVVRIINDRRALGEHQPCGKGRQPEGPAIPNYFPAAVSEAEYFAALAGVGDRRTKSRTARGEAKARVGKHVNLFARLLRNARDGDTYIAASKPNRVIVNHAAQQGQSRAWSFPLPVFEEAILSELREIDPHEILNGDQGPDEAVVLAGQLAKVEAELAEAAAFMEENGFSATIGKRVAALEASQGDLAARLALARQRAEHPLSECWGEGQTLMGALASAADPRDARLRLRAILRRIVDSVWLLVVPRGLDRLCAVQIWFSGERRCRNYLLLYKRGEAKAIRPPSIAKVMSADDLDLRRREDAEALEQVLSALDLTTLQQ